MSVIVGDQVETEKERLPVELNRKNGLRFFKITFFYLMRRIPSQSQSAFAIRILRALGNT